MAEYLARGPGFIFLFHPALGPLWEVIGQKLACGRLAPGAELVLQVAEVAARELDVQGSFLVTAHAPMGAVRGSSPSSPGRQQATGSGAQAVGSMCGVERCECAEAPSAILTHLSEAPNIRGVRVVLR